MKWLILTAVMVCLGAGCGNNPGPSAEEKGKASPAVPPAQTQTANTNEQVFQVKGVVQRIEDEGKTLVIKHEKIPDYMEAMTMPFEVKNTNETVAIKPGDIVSFKMIVLPEDGWITNVVRVGRTNVDEEKRHPTNRIVRDVNPLKVGDPLPDYPFTNELGQKISLGQFQGQAMAFTFIFTRCPFPNFCPRMSDNFAKVYQKLQTDVLTPTNWHLLSISFDPEWDTPERLKKYGERYKYDASKWNFITGAFIDIDAITEQVGMSVAYRSGTYDHTLRTVVVDTNGKVQRIIIGNDWTVEDLAQEIVIAARVPLETKKQAP